MKEAPIKSSAEVFPPVGISLASFYDLNEEKKLINRRNSRLLMLLFCPGEGGVQTQWGRVHVPFSACAPESGFCSR